MPSIDCVRKVKISSSSRIKQMGAMFDVPIFNVSSISWKGEIPFEEKDWNIGLITGPSGAGKSVIAEELFGKENVQHSFEWENDSVIDDFDQTLSIGDIARVCQSVGFNTIPSWMRPYHVLSNGEKFRVEIARSLLEENNLLVIDEFSSVVDRQVAKITSHAVQKYIRKKNRKFVAVSCHKDIIDWLQPDWVFEPSNMNFRWRRLRQRPKIEAKIGPVKWDLWKIFSKYHYMNASLLKGARCFALFVNEEPVSFVGSLIRPCSVRGRISNLYGISRMVTLPDWQGLGLAFILMEFVGAFYAGIGKRLRIYPAHFSFYNSALKSGNWKLIKKLGDFNTLVKSKNVGMMGGKSSAVLEYIGKPFSYGESKNILEFWKK